MKILIALFCLVSLPALAGPAVSTGTGDTLGNNACAAQQRDRGEHFVQDEDDLVTNPDVRYDSRTDQWVSSSGAQQEGGCFSPNEP